MGYQEIMEDKVKEAKENSSDPLDRLKRDLRIKYADITNRISSIIDNYEKSISNYDDLDERMLNYILSLYIDFKEISNKVNNRVSGGHKFVSRSDTFIEINKMSYCLADLNNIAKKVTDLVEGVIDGVVHQESDFVDEELREEIFSIFHGGEMYDFTTLKNHFGEYSLQNGHYFSSKIKDKIEKVKEKHERITGNEYSFPAKKDNNDITVKNIEIKEDDSEINF